LIAIIGAGITGLALARELRRTGREHVVLESATRAGGVIRSDRVAGRVLERGPQRVRMTREMRELVDELDLGREVVTAPPGLPLFVYARGRLRPVPFSPPELLRTDLFTPATKLRLLAEPLTAGASPDERVSTLLTRKFGRRVYEDLLGPLYGGLYASDPAEMVVELSLGHVLQELGVGRSMLLSLLRRGGRVSPPPAVSFRDGLQTLTSALHAADEDRVRLGATVTGLRRSGSRLTLTVGNDEVLADRVVITAAARPTAELIRGLDLEAAGRMEALRYNPLAVVHLSADLELPALGYQVGLGEALVTRGVTFNASLFDRRGVYTAYLGGARAPEVADWPDEVVSDTAVAEFRRVTGASAAVLSVSRASMPAWDASWAALTGLTVPDGVTLANNWTSRPGIPGRLAQARRVALELF
jgi:oxygen-dependent protoporphyrinogen oxidase